MEWLEKTMVCTVFISQYVFHSLQTISAVPSRAPEREVVRESAGAAMARAGGMLLQGLGKMLLAEGFC